MARPYQQLRRVAVQGGIAIAMLYHDRVAITAKPACRNNVARDACANGRSGGYSDIIAVVVATGDIAEYGVLLALPKARRDVASLDRTKLG